MCSIITALFIGIFHYANSHIEITWYFILNHGQVNDRILTYQALVRIPLPDRINPLRHTPGKSVIYKCVSVLVCVCACKMTYISEYYLFLKNEHVNLQILSCFSQWDVFRCERVSACRCTFLSISLSHSLTLYWHI